MVTTMKIPSIKSEKGFSLIEVVLIMGILVLLSGMALLKINNQKQQSKEIVLQQSLKELRLSIYNYFLDHGYYPCSEKDYNPGCDVETFKKQLLWYTNDKGKPAKLRNREYRFGPYLPQFPIEPFTELQSVKIDTMKSKSLIEFKLNMANETTAKGGWLYQTKTGFIIANLNRKFFTEFYAFN